MVTDPIADLLTRMRNGQRAGHKAVLVSGSKMNKGILDVLQAEGFITSFTEAKDDRGFKMYEVVLKYFEGQACMTQIKRVSKPGKRIYAGVDGIPKVDCGLGIAVISTSKGILSDRNARKERVGGEVLALVS